MASNDRRKSLAGSSSSAFGEVRCASGGGDREGEPVLLRVGYAAGHTGFDATRRQEDLNTADMVAFALWQTGDPDFQQ